MFIVIKLGLGELIDDVISRSIELSKLTKVGVQFKFNGVTIMVSGDSDFDVVLDRYNNNIGE